MNGASALHLEPARAYNHLARQFAQISERRRSYLAAVERLIVAEMPEASRSLLDIGAGDASRALRIAHACGIPRLVLLEPSAAMRQAWPSHAEHWPIAADQLSEKHDSFDAITCLWNTLGHIFPARTRVAVLAECARLLAPRGRLFVDVSYRYNARHYLPLPTLARALYDFVRPAIRNGDVNASWVVEGQRYSTFGHVFTHWEFAEMARAAGLLVCRQFNVDYATGELCQSKFQGNPLFVLRLP